MALSEARLRARKLVPQEPVHHLKGFDCVSLLNRGRVFLAGLDSGAQRVRVVSRSAMHVGVSQLPQLVGSVQKLNVEQGCTTSGFNGGFKGLLARVAVGVQGVGKGVLDLRKGDDQCCDVLTVHVAGTGLVKQRQRFSAAGDDPERDGMRRRLHDSLNAGCASVAIGLFQGHSQAAADIFVGGGHGATPCRVAEQSKNTFWPSS